MATDEAAAADDPLERHRTQTEAALRSQDEDRIKALYIDLGRDFWNRTRNDSDYEAPILSVPETLNEVTKALGSTDGMILDAGCGPNPAVAISLAKAGSRSVVILDIGWGTVRTATAIAEAHGLALIGVAGDLERLPFRDGVFDGLVCDDTIEHLPNDRAGVRELARVLRRGGQAALATPNRHSAAVLRARLRDRIAGIRRERSNYFVASSHLREYTWSEFEGLVRPSFVIDHRRPVGWSVGRKKRLLSRLLWLPGLSRTSQMIVLQCRPRLPT
jgi:SAM-dependent methyltransferase